MVPRTVWGCQPVRAVNCAIVPPAGERSIARSWDCLVPAGAGGAAVADLRARGLAVVMRLLAGVGVLRAGRLLDRGVLLGLVVMASPCGPPRECGVTPVTLCSANT